MEAFRATSPAVSFLIGIRLKREVKLAVSNFRRLRFWLSAVTSTLVLWMRVTTCVSDCLFYHLFQTLTLIVGLPHSQNDPHWKGLIRWHSTKIKKSFFLLG